MGSNIMFATTPLGTSGSANRWEFNPDGHLLPFAPYNLGSDASRVGTVFSLNGDFTGTVRGTNYGGFASFFGNSANGTKAAPTASKAGDPIAVFQGVGHGASAWGTGGAAFVVRALEDWTDTAQGAGAYVSTTLRGTTAITARWEFKDDGSFMPFADGAYDIGAQGFRASSLMPSF